MPSRSHRAAAPMMAIDGVTAVELVIPADAQETAAVLAEAAARGQAVAPMGGGTALSLGNVPERLDVALSTERLSGIIDYEPTDLVLSVGAGARFGDVQAALGEHGQRLPLDPPGAEETTIGGLIATARSGPLRHSAGTLRDLLVGIAVAHPSGTISRAGGMVVKNVSGYDMPRLYHGSLGTLGVIVSANFKVLPRPRAEATVFARFEQPVEAFAAADRVRGSGAAVAALEVIRRDDRWVVATRVEGRENVVDSVTARVADIVGGDANRLDHLNSYSWWSAYMRRQRYESSGDDVLVRCGARPKETATLAMGIAAATANLGVDMPLLFASPGIGTVVARLDFGKEGSAERLAEMQTILRALAETVTILAAPPDWKRGIDVWGQLPDGFEVMRAVRQEFDPERTINPGRFAGFL